MVGGLPHLHQQVKDVRVVVEQRALIDVSEEFGLREARVSLTGLANRSYCTHEI
jgi:hypothetical protein